MIRTAIDVSFSQGGNLIRGNTSVSYVDDVAQQAALKAHVADLLNLAAKLARKGPDDGVTCDIAFDGFSLGKVDGLGVDDIPTFEQHGLSHLQKLHSFHSKKFGKKH